MKAIMEAGLAENRIKIAIDGVSAAGKSTAAKALASRLNILYLDTGAFYRALALKAYQSRATDKNKNNSAEKDSSDSDKNSIKMDFNSEQVEQLIKSTSIDVKYIDGEQRIFLDGSDVSQKIREHHISKLASDISAIKEVRLFMVSLQRQIASKQSSVLDGRDIGSFVLPDAQFKFYLFADIDERAKRRYNELRERGVDCDLHQIKEDIRVRDYNDSNRAFAPLKKTEDAIEIDSTFLTPKEVVDKMIFIINGKK